MRDIKEEKTWLNITLVLSLKKEYFSIVELKLNLKKFDRLKYFLKNYVEKERKSHKF